MQGLLAADLSVGVPQPQGIFGFSRGGFSARKGRLAPGYDADLLVLDGDLETDVTALHRPRSVLLRGLPVSL